MIKTYSFGRTCFLLVTGVISVAVNHLISNLDPGLIKILHVNDRWPAEEWRNTYLIILSWSYGIYSLSRKLKQSAHAGTACFIRLPWLSKENVLVHRPPGPSWQHPTTHPLLKPWITYHSLDFDSTNWGCRLSRKTGSVNYNCLLKVQEAVATSCRLYLGKPDR